MVYDDEITALTTALLDFYHYHKYQYQQIIHPRKVKFQSLTPHHQSLLPWYQHHTQALQRCIDINDSFCKTVALTMGAQWGVPDPTTWQPATDEGYDRVRSMMMQLVREWSGEGIEERQSSYDKIIADLNHLYPAKIRHTINILTPGCGLGRMVYELCYQGYNVEGNEFGYHVMILNQFMINFCDKPWEIHPFLHKSSNVVSRDHQLRSVTIPHISDQPTTTKGSMMMVGGSFIDIYGPNDLEPSEFYLMDNADTRQSDKKFDVIITCFFLDTAPNVMEYLSTIYHRLTTQGKWMNLGPLQWHFEDDYNVVFKVLHDGTLVPTMLKGLELSKDDLMDLINYWFKFDHRETITSSYAVDSKLMSHNIYDCEYWILSLK